MTFDVRAFIPDLMDQSRLDRFNVEVDFVNDALVLFEASADLYVVDLTRFPESAFWNFRPGPRTRLVGFAPHVDNEAITEARSAGFDAVLPRSIFFRRFPEI